MGHYSPASFLNPVETARAAGGGVTALARTAAEIAAQSVATGLSPIGRAAEVAGEGQKRAITFLQTETKDWRDWFDNQGNKVLVGETILVVGILGGLGLLVWYLANSENARRAAYAGGKMLAVKAASRGMR